MSERNNRLSARDLDRLKPKLEQELGAKDCGRFAELLESINAENPLRLSEALAATFPEQSKDKALTSFRQFRQRIFNAAEECNIALTLNVDSKKRNSPEQRLCWFEGDSGIAQAVSTYTENETRSFEKVVIEEQVAVKQFELVEGRPKIKYFVSYAKKDGRLVKQFMAMLKADLATSAKYHFEVWRDDLLIAGDNWFDEIQTAIAQCEFGLLLVSQHFLASHFIKEHELPQFISPAPGQPKGNKSAVPVALKPVEFDGTMNLHGLEQKQFYMLDQTKAYSDLTTIPKKEEFVRGLFKQIDVIAASLVEPQQTPFTLNSANVSATIHEKFRKHTLHSTNEVDECCFIDNEGVQTSLHKSEQEVNDSHERCTALNYLEEWLANPKGQHYCALLAEYGMGKTTTSMMLARQLLEKRKKDPNIPLPIYLDLRNLGDISDIGELSFDQVISRIIKRSWKGGGIGPDITAQEVIQLVQQQGALIIYDGLDEVLVHLTSSEGQRFTRELYRVLPPAIWRDAQSEGVKPNDSHQPGRVLITCRTHYFRTLREQKNHLLGEDRESLTADDYAAFILLPFSEKQIKHYLMHACPNQNVDVVIDTIAAVHNLTELAQRPYLLKLISSQIESLERWRTEGRTVTGVSLYREFVLSWLERDAGKHQLTPDHKQMIMQHFAVSLWQSGEKSWSIQDTEQWLIDFLSNNPKVAAHYGLHTESYTNSKQLELFKEDLRTATFLIREGEARFRFAHSSLQEYFIASYLYSALLENKPEHWQLSKLSPETLEFLGQHLQECKDNHSQHYQTIRTSLESLKSMYRENASERFVDYTLLALEKGYPCVPLDNLQIQGGKLKELTFKGDRIPLNLKGADFSQAKLKDIQFQHVNLAQSAFTQATLNSVEFVNSNLNDAQFAQAGLVATDFQQTELCRSGFSQTTHYRTRWLNCNLLETRALPTKCIEASYAQCRNLPELQLPLPPALTPKIQLQRGHSDWVTACAFSHDSSTILSAAYDNTLRLWDAHSGECIRTLEGHSGPVMACAFSLDGSTILSAAGDKTLRLWDAHSGECIRTLQGHSGAVMACAFSLDGSTILSAAYDNTLRLWDAHSGECIRTLEGHSCWVRACAFAHDDSTILSAAGDNTLRLWDAHSGECIRTLQGHSGAVMACAFSLDGSTILSAAGDNTLRLWDAHSGECIRTLQGHSGAVMACAFSLDGSTILSAAYDNTLRLWDAHSGECIRTLEGHSGTVRACAFSHDGSTILSAAGDNTLRLWDAHSGECIRTLEGHSGAVRACAFSLDGSTILSAAYDNTLRLWDAHSGECIRTLEGHSGPVMACAFSLDGSTILSAAGDNTLRLWDAHSGERIRTLQGHSGAVMACAFSLDGSTILSAAGDNTLRLWDAHSGECIRTLEGHSGAVMACAFSLDGSTILSAAGDNTLRLWDAHSGECIRTLEGHSGAVRACAFSLDGSTILSAAYDNTLRLWDAHSGECIRTFQGHSGPVMACAFSLDGSTILSAAYDNTLRLWDAHSGERIRTLKGHSGPIRACVLSHDGSTILSAADDNTLRLWDAHSGQLKKHFWQQLAPNCWATIDLSEQDVIAADEEAWRYLGYPVWDSESGRTILLPLETFGPVPRYS